MNFWLLLLIFVVAEIGLTKMVRALDETKSPFAGVVRALRNLVAPTVFFYLWLDSGRGDGDETPTAEKGAPLRVFATLMWVSIVHAALGLLNALLFESADTSTWRGRAPKLFLDLVRFFLVLLGAAVVMSEVWGANLGDMITALGVGSIVIGLALQDTLGNLMAGIALLFERPFNEGDWIRVGTTTGRVIETNWRSVRLETREREMIVVPNSVLGKEIIANFTNPRKLHAERPQIGFSYSDPPNKVKRVLKRAALATRGVLTEPAPQPRTLSYDDFQITYEVKLFISDYEALPDILDEYTSRLWYAAKRNGLTIPFPIRTVYKTEMPPAMTPPEPPDHGVSLSAVPVFGPLEADELAELAHEAVAREYGRGERLVNQGDAGDAMFVIGSGHAEVLVTNESGREQVVARLGPGEFFGEMALLTGEPRSATVEASDDMQVVVVYSNAMRAVLERRPDLARDIAEVVETRQAGLSAAREAGDGPAGDSQDVEHRVDRLLGRIKHFLGV